MSAYVGWLLAGGIGAIVCGAVVLHRSGASLAASLGVPLLAVSGAVFGGWLLGALLHPSLRLEDGSAFGLDGGLIFGGLSGLFASRLFGHSGLKGIDAIALGAGLGIALARIGCLQAGCCFGRATDLPWGVSCEFGSEAHLIQVAEGLSSPFADPLPLHPTAAYEMAAGALGGFGALLAIWLGARPGIAAFGFAAWIAAFRLANAAFRQPDTSAAISPLWITAVVLAIGVAGLAHCLGRLHESTP